MLGKTKFTDASLILGVLACALGLAPFISDIIGHAFDCNYSMGGTCGRSDIVAFIYGAFTIVAISQVFLMGSFSMILGPLGVLAAIPAFLRFHRTISLGLVGAGDLARLGVATMLFFSGVTISILWVKLLWT